LYCSFGKNSTFTFGGYKQVNKIGGILFSVTKIVVYYYGTIDIGAVPSLQDCGLYTPGGCFSLRLNSTICTTWICGGKPFKM